MKTRTKTVKNEVFIKGVPASAGIAIGPAFVFRSLAINLAQLELKIEDTKREIKIFADARNSVLDQLEYARKNSETNYGPQFSEIFESQKAFLQDPVLIKEIEQEIQTSGMSAVHVVSQILSQKSEYFSNLENTYFRDRAFDITDLKQKLVLALLGINIDYHLSTPSIIIAESLSPTDTVNFNRNFILGISTDKGGKNSHAAILAKGLQIPAVINGINLSHIIQQDDYLIIDGFNGTIVLNPSPKTHRQYEKLQQEHKEFDRKLFQEVKKKTVSVDKQPVQMLANIEFLHEVNDVKRHAADGIGLFRTESIFIGKKSVPSEEMQFEVYRKIVEQMKPQPVTIRTLDLGGDKLSDGFTADSEANPFLGWRAIRFCLDRPEVFKTQLRAICRASAYGVIKILIPMITSVDEIRRTLSLMDQVQESLITNGRKHKCAVPLGVMIETPAAAVSARFLAPYVDFFSIGTNDLTQYVLAMDRTNDKVADGFNTFNPAVLELIALTIETAVKHEIDVNLCGEFAAVSHAIPLLLGMGLRSFSMNPYSLAEAKKVIRSLDISDCVELYEQVKQLPTAEEIEGRCKRFVKRHVPELIYL